jgi:hypothetical protein
MHHMQVFGATACTGTRLVLQYSLSDTRCDNGAV